ncbi:MAG: hypothetical protein ACTSUE_10625 [Promethearchaeota archaeon]
MVDFYHSKTSSSRTVLLNLVSFPSFEKKKGRTLFRWEGPIVAHTGGEKNDEDGWKEKECKSQKTCCEEEEETFETEKKREE